MMRVVSDKRDILPALLRPLRHAPVHVCRTADFQRNRAFLPRWSGTRRATNRRKPRECLISSLMDDFTRVLVVEKRRSRFIVGFSGLRVRRQPEYVDIARLVG